jgi:glycerol-3-phosphate dehydrogenase (NAD(P)+)
MTSLGGDRPERMPIAVLGAGSWGTALAIHCARVGHPTRLYGRDAAHLARLAITRRNDRYLPDVAFPDGLVVEADLNRAIDGALDILIVVPSSGLRETLMALAPVLSPGQRVVWATKGFDHRSLQLPHEVARETLGAEVALAVLSGPTFASEVGRGLPTAMTVAATTGEFAQALAVALTGHNFRVYTSTDLTGVEVGGAVKNVIAIATGIADGLGFGANTRAALITRGLAEMTRLGCALGAQPETFMGLAALGDLVLTCTDDQSRNRRFGLAIAAGRSPREACASIGQVVEGFGAASVVDAVAARRGIDMPITRAVCSIIHEGVPADDAARALMARTVKPEHSLSTQR